jgi:hypothetical protein
MDQNFVILTAGFADRGEKERHSADSQAPLPTAQSKFPIPHWITSFSARLPIEKL